MAGDAHQEEFGSTEALVRFIQERSEDIEKVVIMPPGKATHRKTRQAIESSQIWGLLRFASEWRCIKAHDLEAVLNDGILGRMKVKIEIADRSVQDTPSS